MFDANIASIKPSRRSSPLWLRMAVATSRKFISPAFPTNLKNIRLNPQTLHAILKPEYPRVHQSRSRPQ